MVIVQSQRLLFTSIQFKVSKTFEIDSEVVCGSPEAQGTGVSDLYLPNMTVIEMTFPGDLKGTLGNSIFHCQSQCISTFSYEVMTLINHHGNTYRVLG